MPRQARTLGESGYMHLIVRGIGKQIMFEEAADYRKFLALLERFCKETEVKPCAYCLMDNHVHLLVCDPNGNTPLLMKKLGVSYALYFNRKYDRSGHLLQDRYLSETVDSDAYLLMVFRYILNNPGKAGICDARNYPWNSYAQYDLPEPWMELSLVRSLLGGLSEYEAFIDAANDDQCLEYDKPRHDDACGTRGRFFCPGCMSRRKDRLLEVTGNGSNGIDLSFLSGIAKASPDFLYQIILPAKLCRSSFLGSSSVSGVRSQKSKC